jgi:tetratricopeptide (TPR) repeat protein
MPDMGQRYWAFISYSHADSRWANRLHRQLEGFSVPRRLVGHPTPVGPAPKRFRPIFKDIEELGASSDLSERLRSALAQSAYLIVICSPAATRSKWVDAEIRQFKALHGKERVLAVIVDGEPFASDDPDRADQECLPEALRLHVEAGGSAEAVRFEPVAADLRPGKGGLRLAVLKLMSGMLAIDLGELVQRDNRRRHQQMLTLTTASVLAAVLFGGLAITAVVERDEAVAQRGQAEGLVEFMIGDLRKRLEPEGRLDALDAVGARALGYYAAQQSHGLDAASLGRRARVLHMLGQIRDRRGDLDAALGLFEQASRSTGQLLAEQPNDPQRIFEQAQSDYWVGYIALRRGQDDAALRQYQDYRRLADRLVKIDPNNAGWLAELDYANLDTGVVLLDQGRSDAAAQAFERALAIGLDVAQRAPADRDHQFDLGQNYAWLAAAEYHRGRLDAALADRMAERAVYTRLIAQAPSDESAVLSLAINRYTVGQILLTKGQVRLAIESLLASKADLDRLMAAAPDDTEYKNRAVYALLLLGQARLQSDDLDGAEAVAGQARDLAEALVRKNPTVADWQGPCLGGARVLLVEIDAARARSPAAQKAALEPAMAEGSRLLALSRSGPADMAEADAAAEAALLAGDHASLDGRPDQARPLWASAQGILQRAGAGNLPPSDRSRTLLRELGFRLSLLHPPTGPVLTGPPFAPQTRPASGIRLVDYRW